MSKVCLYFQVHQPNRLRPYTYFDIGQSHDYENDELNKNILLKVASKCYLPMNALLLKLIKRYQGAFKVSFSISGTLIDQLKRFSPETLASFQTLAATGDVEFINETYYHSLCFLFSNKEFKEQIKLHQAMIKEEFGYRATTFRNTELIYNNDIARTVESLGYKTILTEGADKILSWRSPHYVYRPEGCEKIKLLLKSYRLSDDVAFRFSNTSWVDYPLTADKYAYWLHTIDGQGDIINLFMDYETFGEHQWAETGIFDFMEKLPEYVLKHPHFSFATPSEASNTLEPVSTLNVPDYISWADVERDLTAWRGNPLQEDALQTLYRMEKSVHATHDESLLKAWRSLQTSDHFYYMCTKYAADGDVHQYFNPYHNPYEAYINYQNIMADLERQVTQKLETKQ